MIKIEVTGNSLAEVSDKLLAIGARLRASNLQTAHLSNAEVQDWVPEAAEGKPTVGTEKAKRTRKGNAADTAVGATTTTASTAEESPAAVPEIPTETASPQPEAPRQLNFDKEVAPLVLKLVQTKGPEAIKAILDQFGVQRASQIDPARFGELVDLVQDAL